MPRTAGVFAGMKYFFKGFKPRLQRSCVSLTIVLNIGAEEFQKRHGRQYLLQKNSRQQDVYHRLTQGFSITKVVISLAAAELRHFGFSVTIHLIAHPSPQLHHL